MSRPPWDDMLKDAAEASERRKAEGMSRQERIEAALLDVACDPKAKAELLAHTVLADSLRTDGDRLVVCIPAGHSMSAEGQAVILKALARGGSLMGLPHAPTEEALLDAVLSDARPLGVPATHPAHWQPPPTLGDLLGDAELAKNVAATLGGLRAERRDNYMRNRLPPRTDAEKAARAKARAVRKRQKLARRRNRK